MSFNVQYREQDKEIGEALQILAVKLSDYLPPGNRRGGSALAQAIVKAAIQTGQVEALLRAAQRQAESTPPPSKSPKRGRSAADHEMLLEKAA